MFVFSILRFQGIRRQQLTSSAQCLAFLACISPPMFSPQASACRAETATTPPFSGPPCCSCYCPGLLGSSHLKLTFFVYTLNFFFTLFYLENHSCLTASLPMLNSSFLHIFSGLFEGKTDLNCKTLIICRKCSDFCLDFFTRETAWLL